ncbi:MAG: hypothetical protein NT039_02920 [Candidatus Berkelbacteria bacterium]|nr:hypothetical protein [Candidatus Berkelbacteria bacterium]
MRVELEVAFCYTPYSPLKGVSAVILLGQCPNCNSADSLLINRGDRSAQCSNCQKHWDRYEEAKQEGESVGQPLTLVWIDSDPYYVVLRSPRPVRVPCERVVRETFNAALIERFGFHVCFACEGGVQGTIDCGYRQPGWVELRNDYYYIGLSTELFSYGQPTNAATRIALGWYEDLLRQVFELPLCWQQSDLGRGAIFKLPPTHEFLELHVQWILWLALGAKTKDPHFAARCLARMSKVADDPIAAPFHTGLTDEQIVQRFVPPSGFDDFLESLHDRT